MRKVSTTYISLLLVVAAAMLTTGCNNTKYLAEGESLFVGSDIDFNNHKAARKEEKVMKSDLEAAVTPEPNKKFLGMRIKLAIYNRVDSPKKEKGFRHWLKYKIGEPPVLMSDVDLSYNQKLLSNLLENHGFFFPTVNVDAKTNRKKTKLHFDITTDEQYKIRNVTWPDSGKTRLYSDIFPMHRKTLLKKDAPYNLNLIKGERERINSNLKNEGYYYFVPEYLYVRADTTVGDHQVDMEVKVKDNIPEKGSTRYHIGNIFINPDYALDKDSTQKLEDTLAYHDYIIVGNTKKYRRSLFRVPMQYSPGELYNREDEAAALSRLVNMGTFKFVKNEFKEVYDEEEDRPELDVHYALTPYPKKSLQMEIGAVTKNDSRAGSQVSVKWKNRNTFKGAELFTIKLSGAFETQYSGAVRRPNTYQVGIEPSLTFPRFVIPFLDPHTSSKYIPKTKITTGYDLLWRVSLFRLHTVRAGYGFNWKEDARKEHEFFPFNITYVKADTLNQDSASQINFSNLLFNGIIVGPTYSYTFNTRGTGSIHKHDFYFNGQLDLSANVIGLSQGASVDEAPKTFLGARYAQYAKATAELRHYNNYDVSKHSIWANRLFIGFGLPYGNSSKLPNIKQFFSGGNSSLRGFRSRLVGPGTFNEQYRTGNITFIETNGDIKLELNSEIRAQLYDFIHGAAFVDAGNIWLYRPSTDFPGGEISSDFLKEIAVSGGVGIRFDFNILVLRFDFGIPLRKPWLADGDRWVLDDIQLGNPVWRKQNLIFNLAIGYPF